jgi:DNA-binding MarR family transcriptional regulator
MKDKPDTKDLKSIAGIDAVVHEPARLMILAHLYVVESADFLFLMRQTELTPGNLSSHLAKLEEAGYVAIEKEFVERKPHTMINLTKEGRAAMRDYVRSMKQVLDDLPFK